MITTDINYPSQLPGPQSGYSINPVSPLLRTTMADGRAEQRRRFSSTPSMVDLRWVFNSANEAAYFEYWYKNIVFDGAAWFNCPLETPIGYKPYVCRFTDIYSGLRKIGVCTWEVSANIEIFERPIMDGEWAEFPDFYLNADIIDVALNRLWPEA